MKEQLKMNARFVVDALRNAGYNNYSAIADIIDNSLETDVSAEHIYINVGTVKNGKDKEISSISIIDDGNGMSLDILKEAMCLGANTGKTAANDLGMYGVGLKSAALSIGQKLEVFSKTINDVTLHYACLDITDFDGYSNIEVNYIEYDSNSEEFKNFIDSTYTNNGTIVRISNLDKLSNKSFDSFSGTISLKIRQIFNKFIEAGTIVFYVNGDKLTEFDPIGNKFGGYNFNIIKENTISYRNNSFKYKFWYSSEKSDKKHDANYWGVNHSGIFIYRQNRLVGEALDLGIAHTKGDGYGQGIKIELFIDGTADSLFSTTFTKMISEKDQSMLDQGFKDLLVNELKPLVDQCKRIRENQMRSEVNKDTAKNLEKITEDLNKNRFLKNSVNTYGKNKKHEENNTEENDDHKKQKNPNPHKIRKEQWFAGFDYVSDGTGGKMYQAVTKDNKPYLQLNTDHAFYKEIFSQLSAEAQQLLGMYLACDIIAKQKSDYWIDDDNKKILDMYFDEYADAVKRAFID